MLYRSLRACEVLRRDRLSLTCRVKHRDMIWALCLLNFGKKHSQEKCLSPYHLPFLQVIRAFGINTFVYDKVLSVFFGEPACWCSEDNEA